MVDQIKLDMGFALDADEYQKLEIECDVMGITFKGDKESVFISHRNFNKVVQQVEAYKAFAEGGLNVAFPKK